MEKVSNRLQLLLLAAVSMFVLMSCAEAQVQVEITSGLSLVKLEDTILYREEEQVVFPIPDIPELMDMSFFGCSGPPSYYGSEVCSLVNHTNVMLNQSTIMTSLLRKLYTVDGLSDTLSEDLAREIIDSVNLDLMKKDPTLKDVVSAAGLNWFKNVTRFRSKVKRNPALVKVGLALLPQLKGLVQNLFVHKGQVVKALIGRMAFASKTTKPFAFMLDQVSELVKAEDQGTRIEDRELAAAKAEVKKLHETYLAKDADYIGLMTLIASTLPDLAYLQYHNTLSAIHGQAFSTCRGNEIPIAFLPPGLLGDRLKLLDSELSEEYRMVIPPSEVMKYYKNGGAHCVYTDDGGLLAVDIPLVPAQTKLELFKVSSILYAWGDRVCDVGIDEMLVIRDTNSNDVFPISEVAQEQCKPFTSKRCQVPLLSTADTDEHLCLRAILRGAPTTELRQVCKLDCRVAGGLEISQPTPEIVIVTNLKDGAIASSKTKSVQYLKRERIGATRVTLPCGWKLELEGKVIARSLTKMCIGAAEQLAKFEELVPAHWTNLDTWVSDGHDVARGTRFVDFKSVVNMAWNETEAQGVVPWIVDNYNKMSWITGSGQMAQGAVTGYIFYRLHRVDVVLAGLVNAVGAFGGATCNLPVMTETVIYLTLSLVIALTFPAAIMYVKDGVKRAWNYAVAKAAEKQNEGRSG